MDETVQKIPPVRQERSIFESASIDWAIKIGCLALLVYWSVLLIQPFLTIIIWSVILVVALYPIFDWMVSRLRLPRILARSAAHDIELCHCARAGDLARRQLDRNHRIHRRPAQ